MAVAVARSAVQLCPARVTAAGLTWPLPATLTDHGLEAMLCAPMGGSQPGIRHKAEPDWAAIHHELRRPGVTLQLLSEDVSAIAPFQSGAIRPGRFTLRRSRECRAQ